MNLKNLLSTFMTGNGAIMREEAEEGCQKLLSVQRALDQKLGDLSSNPGSARS